MNKSITIIVLLSIVWSIVSSIIQKRAAAAKKLQMQQGGGSLRVGTSTVPQVFNVDPRAVKIEALRRKQQQRRQPTSPRSTSSPIASSSTLSSEVKQTGSSKIAPIEELHDLDCPVPATRYGRSRATPPSRQLAVMLGHTRNIRTAIVLNEILSKPIALRYMNR
mgnify:CR=1 FL=1